MSEPITRLLGVCGVGLLWGLPLAAGLLIFTWTVFDPSAWRGLLQHPQLLPSAALSIWTGAAGLGLSLLFALLIAVAFPALRNLQAFTAAGLALPHVAFSIGFGFLIMPSGILARLFVGGDATPQWVTTQDPLGLSLIACLALKETPFLLAMIWSELGRADSAFAGEARVARSLGHGMGSVWRRVLLPQILPRLIWPVIIVWAYGATVVDMALVIGPTQPPTLGVIVWADLNHADAAINARGAAGAALLSLIVAAVAGLIYAARLPRSYLISGPSRAGAPFSPGAALAGMLVIIYVLIVAILVIMALAARWPYPQLLPQAWRMAPLDMTAPLLLSAGLAFATSLAALALAVLWLETMRIELTGLALAALAIPALVIGGGKYRLFLELGLTGTLAGLWLAHFTAVFAYVVIVLTGPYRAFDPTFRAVAHSLNAGPWRFWLKVKAPLLKAPLLMALAVGFSVSMVQFVPAQLVAAGRYATLPMEAVTLAAGGARNLTAAYALALTLVPALVFLIAQLLARPRWS